MTFLNSPQLCGPAESTRGGAPDLILEERISAALMKFSRHDVNSRETSSILTRATGFIDSFDYTLNPYAGCTLGCSYCYAAFFPRNQQLRDTWGDWVQIKSNAVRKLQRMRTSLQGKSIYMSSVTDPYQPIERDIRLVRDLLPVLLAKGVRLVVQTRSPLVQRDIDYLQEFPRACVNMTVTTDSEEVRKAFEPKCPPLAARLEAIAEIVAAGIPAAITMTPLLPVQNLADFTRSLLATGVQRFVIQSFHLSRSNFVAGTGQAALALAEEMEWTQAKYQKVKAYMYRQLPDLREGKEGFRADDLLA